MAAPQGNKRVVVIPVGISRYRDPTAAQLKLGQQRFGDLPSVNADLERFAALFRSDTYRTNGFELRPVVTGTAGEVTDRLNAIVEELTNDPPATVVLIWSGHGETPDGGDLRLATIETCTPMQAGQGFAPAELVNKLVGARSDEFCVVLDVCQSAAAIATVAETAAQRLREAQLGKIQRMAALFSAQAYEPAKESVFAGALERVLREGPSAEARARIAERGWGGFAHNRLLTMSELDGVMQAEFELLKMKRPGVQTPACQTIGTFGLFPNPLFKSDAPPMGVDTARRRWLDKDRDEHFLPKARGLEPSEEGWFFSGRDAVSRDVVDWLRRRGEAGDKGIYVVTGSGGTGKSAIIGRTMALSDRKFRDLMADDALAAIRKKKTLPTINAVDAALHLRNLNLAQAYSGLGGLLGIAAPDSMDASAWASAFETAKPARQRGMTIALDALDEATEPADIAEKLIQPLAKYGWRFLVGTRPSTSLRGADRLLDRLGPAHVRNLDVEEATRQDIESYVRDRLERTQGSPYADADSDDDRAAMAAKIADKANGQFLFARIAASGLLQRPRIAVAEIDEATGDSVGEALARDLDTQEEQFAARFGRRGVNSLLAALAWARGEGLPLRDGLWALVAGALEPQAPPFGDEHAQWVLVNVGRYIIESGDGEQAVYRLFHESLNEHFRAGHDRADVGVRIATALLRNVEEAGGWEHANPYIVRHVIAHGGPLWAMRDRICTDPWYLRRALKLLGVDRLTEILLKVWQLHRVSAIEAVAKSLQRARVALSRDPDQLAAQLHARLAGEESDALKRLVDELPHAAPRFWLRSRGASLGWRAALETIQTFNANVGALAFGSIEGVSVIAVGAGDQVILWDPRAGALPARTISNDGLRITALAIASLDGQDVIAVASAYGQKLVIRDAGTGAPIGEPIECSMGRIAIGRFEGRPALAAWDGGYRVYTIDGPRLELHGPLEAATVGQVGGALVGVDAVRGDWFGQRWQAIDHSTGKAIGPPVELSHARSQIAVGEFNGKPVLCGAARSGEVRLYDLRTGEEMCSTFAFDFRIWTTTVGEVEGECIVAAGNDTEDDAGYVSIRQPLQVKAAVPQPDPDWKHNRILAAGLVNGRVGRDRPVLLFEGVGAVDPLTWQIVSRAAADDPPIDIVTGAWTVPATITEPPPERQPGAVWMPRPDKPLEWPVECQAWFMIDGRLLEARGIENGAAWVLDPHDGKIVAGPFRGHRPEKARIRRQFPHPPRDTPVTAVSLATWNARLVVAVSFMGRVDVFDVASGKLVGSPATGDSDIVAVSLGESEGRLLLATASSGGAVAVWEGPAMKRLAGMTIDARINGVWLTENVVTVRQTDGQFHVFDLVTNP
jgi:hypothetical protein